MAALTAIREGLALNLSAIPGVQVTPHALGAPTMPCAQVAADDPVLTYDETMQRGIDTWLLMIELFVSLSSDKGAQVKLDALIDQAKAALESDPYLGGTVSDLRVTHIDGYGPFELGERGRALGCRIHVQVIADGT